MQLPNKLYSYNESIISKFPVVLHELRKSPCGVSELYTKFQQEVTGTTEFMEILDCLYALGKVKYDEEAKVLKYVIRNNEH